ncbi:hypothetical protein QD357_10490 [Rhizobium sp. BR 317]|uniref:hypothetical protein n=1 Tax=Rhizobium sp. BR 317 TaxID=3040015 RepID=UPI0039BFE43F
MTVILDKSVEFLGFPASKLQTVLGAWVRAGAWPNTVSDNKKAELRGGVVSAMLGEAWLRGLISTVGHERKEAADGRLSLTEAGATLVTAQKRGRTAKEKAGKVLKGLLDRAQKLSQDAEAPAAADRIWVFGSYVNPEKTEVGDLDVAIECGRTGVVPYGGAIGEYIKKHYPGIVPEDSGDWKRGRFESSFLSKMLYGARRHPLISETDIGILKDLHCPCALVFDRERGGIIEPEYFEHHPDSKRRGDNIYERQVMPDLGVAGTAFEPTPHFVVLPQFANGASAKAIEAAVSAHDENPNRFTIKSISGPSLTVERRMEFGHRRWELTYWIVDGGGDNSAQWEGGAARRLAALAHADLVRLAEHRAQSLGMEEIVVNVEPALHGPDSALAREIRASLFDCLSDEDEPAGIAPSRAYGVHLHCCGGGIGFSAPHAYDDEAWEAAGDTVPFSREEYEQWAEPLEHELDWPPQWGFEGEESDASHQASM